MDDYCIMIVCNVGPARRHDCTQEAKPMATSRPNTLIHMKETVAYNNLQNDPKTSLPRTAITTTFLATARARVEAQRPFCWRVGWPAQLLGCCVHI